MYLLNSILESAEFAELVEELSDPNLKWDKIKHGPKLGHRKKIIILLFAILTLIVMFINI